MKISNLRICALALSGLFAIANVAHAEPAMIGGCAVCHGTNGSGVGIDNVPIIAGTPAAHLEEALYAYKDGARRCVVSPAMCEIVAALSETEIVEFAEHYGAMSRISAGEALDATLAPTGEQLHKKHCAKCHLLPDDEDIEFALGIPLHGQRSAYLKIALDAYLTGDRDTLVPAMAARLNVLDAADIEALINYYASYRP